ncbi:MAG: SoxR reducing system RseC family protein [Treponema sp.]|nr:SoxR reducing system RseC family protein [Treponema sp.]
MRETGFVQAIEGRTVTVALRAREGCYGCVNQDCKAAGRLISGENTGDLPLKPGQAVELEIPRRSIAGEALRTLAPPAAAFIAVWALTGLPAWGDPLRSALSIAALFITALIIYRRPFGAPKGSLPRIIRLV